MILGRTPSQQAGGFAVTNSPWSNGTCERTMNKIVRTLKAMPRPGRQNVI